MTAMVVTLAWVITGVALSKNWNKAVNKLPGEFRAIARLDSPAQKGAMVALWPGVVSIAALFAALTLAYLAMDWLGRKL